MKNRFSNRFANGRMWKHSFVEIFHEHFQLNSLRPDCNNLTGIGCDDMQTQKFTMLLPNKSFHQSPIIIKSYCILHWRLVTGDWRLFTQHTAPIFRMTSHSWYEFHLPSCLTIAVQHPYSMLFSRNLLI